MSTTRISDLPDSSAFPPLHNGGQQMGQQPQMGQQMAGMPNTYAPINIHPNPYGNAPPTDLINSIPQPQHTKENIKYSLDSGINDENAQAMLYAAAAASQQRLPSRDIPQYTQDYTHDPNIQVNYIPPPQQQQQQAGGNDYIREYEQRKEPALKIQEKHKKRVRFADDWLTQFQTPILVMFMYFLFQMPLLNKTMYRILGKTPLYSGDGTLNWMGVLFKSALFGIVYYLEITAIDYISYIWLR